LTSSSADTTGPCGARKRALIVANGRLPGARTVARLAGAADWVIATDGAAQRLARRGITPHAIVGDFDSLAADHLLRFASSEIVHAPDQNACDLEKAVRYALEHGFSDITVVGGLGRRWDHSLTTVSLLIRFARECTIRLVQGRTSIVAVHHQAVLNGAKGDRISLIAFAPVEGLTLTGVQWPLSSAHLEPGSLGVSNRMTANQAEVRVSSGCVVACHTRRRGEETP
jgi:thiamine pyrophosphokinase